jgi:hypothetical protein
MTNGTLTALASSRKGFHAKWKNSEAASNEGTDMRVKIVAFGYFATDVHFKIEGGTEGKELKVGEVVGYLDPETIEIVEFPEIGKRVAMVVPLSLEDSELEELHALPDDRPERTAGKTPTM